MRLEPSQTNVWHMTLAYLKMLTTSILQQPYWLIYLIINKTRQGWMTKPVRSYISPLWLYGIQLSVQLWVKHVLPCWWVFSSSKSPLDLADSCNAFKPYCQGNFTFLDMLSHQKVPGIRVGLRTRRRPPRRHRTWRAPSTRGIWPAQPKYFDVLYEFVRNW